MSETIVVAPAAADEPALPDVALPPGHRLLDRYRLIRVLGRGGFGITYEAEDERLARRVAVKEFFPRASAARTTDSAADSARVRPHDTEQARSSFGDGLKRFWREGQTLARLDHPGIVRVHDVLSGNGTAYLVMEMVPGEALARRLERGRPAPSEVERQTRALLEALAALHAAGIVHCDIKPTNIMVRPDGRPALIDLGSARTQRHSAADGRTTIALALTPDCSAPELFLENPPRIQAAADLFALGHTVHEMVTGRPPPATQLRLATQNTRQGDPLAALAGGDHHGYTHEFLAAVDHALALNVDERLASAADWLARLDAGTKQSRRRPWLTAALLAGLGTAAPALAAATLPDRLAVAGGLALAGGGLIALAGRLSAIGLLTAVLATPALIWVAARLGNREPLLRLGREAWGSLTGWPPPGLDLMATALALAALWRVWRFLRRRLGGVAGTLAVLPGLAGLAGFVERVMEDAAGLPMTVFYGPATGPWAAAAWSLQILLLALVLLWRANPLAAGRRA